MKKYLFSLVAAATMALASLAPAKAMMPGAASGIQSAIQDTQLTEQVRYVCRHRGYSSRRACWWQPPRRNYRPYYRPHRPYYRPYRGPRRGWY